MDQGTIEGFSAAYVIIYSIAWRERLTHIHTVLQQLHQAGLTAKQQKYQFAKTEYVYLGHGVGGGKVKPLPLENLFQTMQK